MNDAVKYFTCLGLLFYASLGIDQQMRKRGRNTENSGRYACLEARYNAQGQHIAIETFKV